MNIFGIIFQKLSKEPLLTFAIFRSESGCKDKTSFYNLQIFGELFSKNFYQEPFYAFRAVSTLDCGCKGSYYFLICKDFLKYF